MTTLREALNRGKLDRFISERKDQPPADKQAFDATLDSMAGKSKSEPGTSTPECGDELRFLRIFPEMLAAHMNVSAVDHPL
jgi:hypothetical protein